ISLRLIMIFDFQHLKTANINYFSHAMRVIKLSFVLIALGIIGIIHGLIQEALGRVFILNKLNKLRILK
ncbi:hypothetical protein OAS54_03780, partial [Gammaproteobacteria bacterium]|nr:hypothetical protein [Gammaproteobacteria bacterium]